MNKHTLDVIFRKQVTPFVAKLAGRPITVEETKEITRLAIEAFVFASELEDPAVAAEGEAKIAALKAPLPIRNEPREKEVPSGMLATQEEVLGFMDSIRPEPSRPKPSLIIPATKESEPLRYDEYEDSTRVVHAIRDAFPKKIQVIPHGKKDVVVLSLSIGTLDKMVKVAYRADIGPMTVHSEFNTLGKSRREIEYDVAPEVSTLVTSEDLENIGALLDGLKEKARVLFAAREQRVEPAILPDRGLRMRDDDFKHGVADRVD